ncbi:MAG: leucyl aminopeptidase [Solirubrobacterales bacterium]|nr:leucyl aminopeptidase [Solirubrobacterales bacterium]
MEPSLAPLLYCRRVKVAVLDTPLVETGEDLVAIGIFEGDELPPEFASAPGADDAKPGFRKTALVHAGSPVHLLVIGLGKRDEFTPERARVIAAVAAKRARALKATSLAIAIPDEGDDKAIAAALIEGAILASYRFDRFKTHSVGSDADEAEADRPRLESLTLIGHIELTADADTARVAAESANMARELQNLPSNIATPTYLAERALELAATHDELSCEVMERDEMVERGMGGLAAVSQGTAEPPKLIVLRYQHGEGGELLGLVGKGVTFDSGGISIKPSGGMQEMKMDMSGAAAVLGAVAAIAELELPVNLVALIPSTENMPSSTAMKPGDIITQLNGKTVEVNNTDAEGRLILADALAYAVELGAKRIVELSTLTGAVLVALGSTYAGLMSNDDAWAEDVTEAAERSGELAWRLPFHAEYKELTKGTVADLTNSASKRKAGTIYAGSFLEEFVGDTPFIHLDIAGTAWDVGREYASKGPTGFGVRLLVDLARHLPAKA